MDKFANHDDLSKALAAGGPAEQLPGSGVTHPADGDRIPLSAHLANKRGFGAA